MATVGYATLQVIPSLQGVTGDLNKQLTGPMADAGRKAGQQLGQGVASGAEQAKATIEKQAAAVAKARATEADAAGKVRVAEAQLQSLRSKGVTDAGRLAAAEEKVNAAKRNAELRSNAAATADRNLARAKETAATAARNGTQSMQQFGDAAEQSSSRMSLMKAAGPLAAAGIAAIGAAAVSAVKFVADIGESFEQMRSKIQLSTGASGEVLDKLNESVKNVAKGSPAAIGTIAERMTVLYQRTGLTGDQLETLTKQVNKAGAALGQDLDLKQLTGTMATFGVQGKDMSAVLDDIFRVSRNTGLGMNEIISAAKTAAPSLQEFGFNLSDSAALIGSLDKAGVDATTVLATFGKGLVSIAKAGQSPKQAFADVTAQIQGFIKQGDTAAAVNVAGKIFGTRGAVQFVNAVKSGAVSMDQLTNAAAKQGDSILDADGATVTWAKTWGLFKNNVIIALEPLATRFFEVFIQGMTWLRENGVVVIQTLSSVLSPVFDAVAPLAERIFPMLGTAVGVVRDVLTGFVTTIASVLEFVGRNRDVFLAIAGVIAALFLPALISLTANLVLNAATWLIVEAQMKAFAIASKISAAATWIQTAATRALNASLLANPVGLIIAAIVALGAALFIAYKKSETFRNIVQSVWGWIKKAADAVMKGLVAAFNWLKNALSPVIDFIKRFWQYLIFGLGPIGVMIGVVVQLVKHWDTVKSVFATVWGVIRPILSGFMTGVKILGAVIGTIVLGTVLVAWNMLKAIFAGVWAFIGPLLGLFVTGIKALGQAAMWLWTNAILPAFNGIQAVIGLWWAGVQVAFDLFKAAMSLVGQAAVWLWQNAILPAWNGIVAAGQFLWSMISAVFGWIQAGISFLGGVISSVVNATIVPAWNFVKAGADLMWQGIKTIFDWITSGWNLLANGIRAVVDSVITPAWNAIKSGLQSVGDFFGTIVSGIQTVWDKLKGYVATPINFVINTVWNNGLLKAWNIIAGFLPGLKQMSPLQPVAFADGGPVPMGAGAQRGKDSVHALLMPDEHVWDVQDVRKSGGQGAQYRMRQMIEAGKPFTWTPGGLAAAKSDGAGNLPRFGDGGGVSAGDKLSPMPGEGGLQDIAKLMGRIIMRLWPKGVSSIGGYRPPDGYNEHSTGRALDVMINDPTTGTQIKDWSMANSPKYPVNWTIWQQKMWYPPDGHSQGMEDRGSPTQNHMDHDHIFYKEQSVDPNVVPDNLVGFDGMSDADRLGIIKKKINEILDKALNPIKEKIGSVIGSPPPEWLGIPPKALDETKTKAVDAAFGFAEKLGDKLKEAYKLAKDITTSITNVVTAPGRKILGLFRDQGGAIPTGQSIVTNETGKPEAVLNWKQLNDVKELMDQGASLSEAIGKVGASKPDSDTIPAGAVVLDHDATADEVKQAADKLKAAADKQSQQQTQTPAPTTTDPSNGAGQPTTNGAGTTTSPGTMKSFKELGSEAGGLVAEGIADFFGLPSWITDPANAIKIDNGENVRNGADTGNSAITHTPSTTTPTTPNTTTPGYQDPTYGDGSTVQQGQTQLTKMPELDGPDGYSQQITKAAKDLGLIKRAAIIGNATALVEAGDPMKMWANSKVPESLKYPHDAVGSDGTSVGLFQQQQNGAWGTLAENMDPYKSAKLFYNALKDVSGWETMDMGAAAQAVQRSGFPDRYATKMGRAEELVNKAALFDTGGLWMPGQLGFNGLNEPEMVLRQDHWDSVDAQTHAVRELVGAGGPRTQITVYGHTAGDIAQEIDRHQWRGSRGYGSRDHG